MINNATQTGAGPGLVELTEARVKQGFPPPREIYLVQNRNAIDWTQVPDWARFVDPDCYDGCCHEG